jgi:transcriptional regulator with XRE-family HTH domain
MLGKKKLSPHVAFGRVLRELRQEKGLSQEALALNANLQRNYISLVERGVNQPTITTILKLAAALNVKPSRMMEMTSQLTTVEMPDGGE